MTVEVCVQTMADYPTTIELARWCESEGVPALAVADHYFAGFDTASAGFDQLVLLGGIARETSTLELSTLVSPVTFRHPAVHLKAGVTLDHLTGGRFTLGLGTGWMELEHTEFGFPFPSVSERFDLLEESLAFVRAGVDGRSAGFSGTHYSLAEFDPQPQPTNLRIVVGGSGPKRTPELAGRFADEFNVFPSETSPSERIATFRAAAQRAGRDPEAILVSTAFPAAVASTNAAAEALITSRAERMKVDADRAIASLEGLGIPHGTPEQAAPAFLALAEAGISRVYLQLSRAPIEEVAETVAAVRAAVS